MVDTDTGEYPAPAGSFLLLRQMSETGLFLPELLAACVRFIENGRLTPSVIARILEQTLRALEMVHLAGYLHGDIQPNNLFFVDTRPEQGDVGFGCLLDFGSARTLLEGGITAPIADRLVFTTPGYTPPELVLHNDGTLCLPPATDLYSVGRLLLYLVKGRTFWERGRDRMLAEWWELSRLSPSDGERLGCSTSVLRLLQRLLDGSLEPQPERRRYQNAQAMLSDAQALVELTAPVPNRLALSVSALGHGAFLGREEQLEHIRQALEAGDKPVILWGFAGMGKTELAAELCRRWRRGRTYFVRVQDSLRHTVVGPIADAFSGYDRTDRYGREKPEEQVYREVMKLLAQRDEGDLLILDNLDGERGFDRFQQEPAFRALCALPMGLVMTTRSPVEGGIELDALPRPLLRALLGRFVELPDSTADTLIDAVERLAALLQSAKPLGIAQLKGVVHLQGLPAQLPEPADQLLVFLRDKLVVVKMAEHGQAGVGGGHGLAQVRVAAVVPGRDKVQPVPKGRQPPVLGLLGGGGKAGVHQQMGHHVFAVVADVWVERLQQRKACFHPPTAGVNAQIPQFLQHGLAVGGEVLGLVVGQDGGQDLGLGLFRQPQAQDVDCDPAVGGQGGDAAELTAGDHIQPVSLGQSPALVFRKHPVVVGDAQVTQSGLPGSPANFLRRLVWGGIGTAGVHMGVKRVIHDDVLLSRMAARGAIRQRYCSNPVCSGTQAAALLGRDRIEAMAAGLRRRIGILRYTAKQGDAGRTSQGVQGDVTDHTAQTYVDWK